MTDDGIFNAAKLGEEKRGWFASVPEGHVSQMSFVRDLLDGRETELLRVLETEFEDRAASRAVAQGNDRLIAALTGLDDDMSAEGRFEVWLLRQLHNNAAPSFLSVVGNPNTGKSSLALLTAELWTAAKDGLIVSNADAEIVDEKVSGMSELVSVLVHNRETPKYVLIDEGSTHFDARTHSRDVAEQFTPVAKRFAKLHVDAFVVIGHTGKDLHPELKRLSTLAVVKTAKKEAEFYSRFPADDDAPSDKVLTVEGLEDAEANFDANDAALWSWDFDRSLLETADDWNSLASSL